MVERVPGPFGPDTHPDDLLLSDYLVGAIDDPALTRSIEEHLASCEDCRQVLAELGEVVRLLDQLPEPTSPRSFRLTPEMAGVGAGASDRRLLRLVPVVRWAGLIAAVFLVALLVTDAVVHHSTSPGTANQAVSTFSTASSASSGAETSSGTSASAATAAAASEPIHADSAARSSASTPASAEAAAATEITSPAAAVGFAATPSSSTPLAGSANRLSRPAGTPAADPAAKTAASSATASPLAQTSGGQAGSSAAAQPPSVKVQASHSSGWRWHIAELALALLVIWLLLLSVILPRLSRGHHTRS